MMKYMLGLAAIMSISTLCGQNQKEDEYEFSFRLVSTPGYIELQSNEGCNWLTLSFSLWKNGDPVFINENGMLGADPSKLEEYTEQSQFLLKVGRTDGKLLITAFKGTHWTEYEDTCDGEYCSIQVKQKTAYPYN